MKILMFGFIAFISWSTLSTYIYVCKIKNLCNEPMATIQLDVAINNDTISADSLSVHLVKKQAMLPDNHIIYFDFDKSDFNADAEMERFFIESGKFLEQNKQARLGITGHTDATGSDNYNQALGNRRAISVKKYFESRGMPENKITIESKGEKNPVDDNSTSDGRANNRRSVITINI